MAYNFIDKSRKLAIKTDDGGVTSGGKIKYRTTTFAGLSETAPAAKVSEAANALASLMEGNLVEIDIQDVNEVLDN